MGEFKKVRLYPIPKIDLHTKEGRERLQGIKNQGPDWPHFDLEIYDETLEKGIIPVFHFTMEMGPPPYPESKLRVYKFKSLDSTHEIESDTTIVYGYPVS